MASPQPQSRPEPLEEERTWQGGAEPTHEPHAQDSAGGGRGIGLGLTTIIGGALIAVPLIWAAYYVFRASSTAIGDGFIVLLGVVMLACLSAGVLLLRGLLKA
ncbi:MAG TPA: hypothetical protein VGQ62_22500 [Chloroflexota bacterium]|jgi:hypothetical protein|nr:hypothetical protein [Chloroflexota bacterium]